MAVKNLNRVLKTVLVGFVKPTASADRVGSGSNVAVDIVSPAIFLSLGQFLMPRLSEPEPRSRQEVADAMSMPPNGIGYGTPESVSGPSARRSSVSTRVIAVICDETRLARSLPTARTAALPAANFWPTGSTSRDRHPGSYQRLRQIGRDCQSPDWTNDDRDPKATLQKQGGYRVTTQTPAAGK